MVIHGADDYEHILNWKKQLNNNWTITITITITSAMYTHTHTLIQKTGINYTRKRRWTEKKHGCINNCEIYQARLMHVYFIYECLCCWSSTLLLFHAIYELRLLNQTFTLTEYLSIKHIDEAHFFQCGVFGCVLLLTSSMLLLFFLPVCFLVDLSLTASWTNVMHIMMYTQHTRVSTTLQTNKC